MGLEDIILAAIIKEVVEKIKKNKRLKAIIKKTLQNGKFSPKEKGTAGQKS